MPAKKLKIEYCYVLETQMDDGSWVPRPDLGGGHTLLIAKRTGRKNLSRHTIWMKNANQFTKRVRFRKYTSLLSIDHILTRLEKLTSKAEKLYER